MTDGPASTLQTDVARIRLVLTRELETISVYEALAREAASPEARAFFEHLAQEEKEHVAEAIYLLRKLDGAQDAHFGKTFSEAHFTSGASTAPQTPSAGEPLARSVTMAPAGPPQNPQRVSEMIEDLRLPHDPRRTVYALPAPPSSMAGVFTVGALKKKR